MNKSPLLPLRNDSNQTSLCSKRSDIHGMSTCCHLASEDFDARVFAKVNVNNLNIVYGIVLFR